MKRLIKVKNRKIFYISIAICLLAFFLVIAYWTVLPRYGTLDISGEGVYTGQLRGMTFNGYGTYISYTVGGTSYEGEWRNGVFHGQGTLTFANGSQLSGEFINGTLQGKALSICPDGHALEIYLPEHEHEHSADCGHDH
jgi:hypothetical protein